VDGIQPDIRPIPDPTILTTQQLLRELSSLREVFDTRLNAMDKATMLLADTVNRTPTVVQAAITSTREVYDERFNSVQQQFAERDVRTEQAATASASALAAALQAAKEAVFEQSQAAAKASDKTELSVTKQIDQIQLQIKTLGDVFNDRIGELKERIDRGEGIDSGSASTKTEHRLDIGQVISALAVLVAVIGLLIVAFRK
jgi:anti-sigma28 factor (negative regulator of flagellin synthesis)